MKIAQKNHKMNLEQHKIKKYQTLKIKTWNSLEGDHLIIP